jgi:hypothetical protein
MSRRVLIYNLSFLFNVKKIFNLFSADFRKEKNVVNTFKVESNDNGDSYNVDNVLQSLGELEKVDKKGNRNSNNKTSNGNSNKNGSSNGNVFNGSHNNNGNASRGRQKSNEKPTEDIGDKKSTSGDENEEDNTSESGGADGSLIISPTSRDYSSTVEFNHIQESFAKNVVLVDESDLKRQVSRSVDLTLSSYVKFFAITSTNN